MGIYFLKTITAVSRQANYHRIKTIQRSL